MAGLTDVGNAAIDQTIQGALADAVLKMGGDGVIHIEFEDQNPPTDVERAADLSESISNGLSGQGGVKTRDRNVIVTGEVIQFLPPRETPSDATSHRARAPGAHRVHRRQHRLRALQPRRPGHLRDGG
ncbi:hypothetical protein ACN28S_42330 [Cystobacter fuscus]